MKKFLKRTLITIIVLIMVIIAFGYYFVYYGKAPNVDMKNFHVKKALQRDNSEYFTIQLIRHSTVLISVAGKKIIVDPMFSKYGSVPPVILSTNRTRNPMVPLSVSKKDLIDVDAIIITHPHFDHFDPEAMKKLPKDIPLFCQPSDEKTYKKAGFKKTIVVKKTYKWGKITLSRTGGQHGKGRVAKMMGKVSGFILATQKSSLYIAGDTIYVKEVEDAVKKFKPPYIIVNAGAAQFFFGEPITMTTEDITNLATTARNAKIIAVHMDAINHCHLTRKKLKKFLKGKKFKKRILIPEDGDIIQLK